MVRVRLHNLVLAAVAASVSVGAAGEAKAWPWPWVNPHIYQGPQQFNGMRYDPFSGGLILQSNRVGVRESALDPFRGFADPGSPQAVNRWGLDAQGRVYHETGQTWSSNGVPHGDLTRTTTVPTGIPGVAHEESQREIYSSRGNGGASSSGFLEQR